MEALEFVETRIKEIAEHIKKLETFRADGENVSEFVMGLYNGKLVAYSEMRDELKCKE